jgi:broad specificity phosphatase PhoE
MYRALLTAQAIGYELGIAPEVWDDVHEHGGIYLAESEGYHTGMTREEILNEFNNFVLPESITEQGWWNRDEEDLALAFSRAIRVRDRLFSMKDTGERIALVTHGTFMGLLLKVIFNQAPSPDIWHVFYNTSITRLNFLENGSVHLCYLNRTRHLMEHNLMG